MITRRRFSRLALQAGLGAGAYCSPWLSRAMAAGETIERVTFAGGNDPIGFNGIDAWVATPDGSLTQHVTDSLLDRHPDGSIHPRLATAWRLVDDVTWEFDIRQGVSFHNGEKLTAESFKTYYDIVLNPQNNSLNRSSQSHVQEAQVVNDYKLRVITKRPTPVALNYFVSVYAVPPEFIRTNGLAAYRRRPIGTGAYRFVDRVIDQRVTLAAQDDYWGGPQVVRNIVYRTIREPSSRIAALLAGEIDLAIDLPPESKAMLDGRPGLHMKSGQTTRAMLLQLRLDRPDLPTANVKVREAINYAIDRDALCRDVLSGAGEPTAFLPPSTAYIDPSIKPLTRDLARARSLLAEAGFPNGFDIDMDTPSGRYIKDKEVAEAIAGQLSEAGIRVNLKTQEWGTLQRRMTSGTGAPITLLAWGFSGDIHGFNNNFMMTGASYYQGTTPEIEALCLKISGEMDPDKRKALVFQEQAMMRTVWPKAFLLTLSQVGAVDPAGDLWIPRTNEEVRFNVNNKLS